MSIHYDQDSRTLHLQSLNTSYIIQLIQDGVPVHAYWGRRIEQAPWPGDED